MSVPAFQNVFLVALSGVSYSEVVGSSNAPNINGYISKYASASNFSALAYPSLPNVLALSSGSTQGARSNTYQQYTVTDLLQDRILSGAKTWKVYAENLPGDPTTSSGGYDFFYNPAIFYNDNYPANSARIVAYTQLATDLASTPPNFGWIIPQVANNMSGGPASVAAGDTWVQTAVSNIQTHLPNALIILWWDSDDGTSNNHVPLVFLSPQQVGVGYTSPTAYTHYNLLSTIEAALGLSSLGANDATAKPMADCFLQGPAGTLFNAPTWVDFSPPDTVFINSPFFYQFYAPANAYPTFAVASGTIPPGLTLDTDFGSISGVPTILGTFMFTLSATNGVGTSLSPPITIEVRSSDVSVNPVAPPDFFPFTDPEAVTQAIDGNLYYFSVTVTTSAGMSLPSPPSEAAQLIVAPLNVTSPVAVGLNASASLTWTTPTDTGGAPLSGYYITTIDETFGSRSAAWFPVSTTATITGLTNGHWYSFVIQAANTDNKILSVGVQTNSVQCVGSTNIISASLPNTPVGTPQPAWPLGIASFPVLTDYPNSPPRDIGFAFNVNVLHAEVRAIEQVLGANPLAELPYETLQHALIDLAVNKSPLVHSHAHSRMTRPSADDHPMYVLRDGSRTFVGPIFVPEANDTDDLVPLGQAQQFGFDLDQLSFGSNPVTGVTAAPPEPQPPNLAVPGLPAPPPPPPPPPTSTTYTVIKGDTLWDIAEDFYGDPTLWPIIYNANKVVIGSNPNLIFPGQVLTIPLR